MELSLHLGAHRTGSTAIEKTLLESRKYLRGQGVAIWPNEKLRQMKGFNLVGDAKNGPAAKVAFGEAWDRVGLARLVICEENMLGTMQDNIGRAAFYPDLPQRMARYRDFLPVAVGRIGIGIREYAGFWTSCYAYVLARKALPAFGGVLGERGWCDLIGDLRSAFPAAEIMVWTLEDVKADLAGVSGRLAGVPFGGLKAVTRAVNAAPDAGYIPAMLALRAREPDLGAEALRVALAGMAKVAGYSLFSEAERAELAERYARDMAALAAGFAGVRMMAAQTGGFTPLAHSSVRGPLAHR